LEPQQSQRIEVTFAPQVQTALLPPPPPEPLPEPEPTEEELKKKAEEEKVSVSFRILLVQSHCFWMSTLFRFL
jgi:hypothetical protein